MRKFEVLDATGSTNTDLLGRPFGDLVLPQLPLGQGPSFNEQVLLVWHQTAGRGQRGQHWQSNTQQSLTFSMSLDVNASAISLEGFSLFVGLCVVEGISHWWQDFMVPFEKQLVEQQAGLFERQQSSQPDLKLKWPNDIVVSSARGLLKVGGVLVETKTHGAQIRLVVGVGVNVFGEFDTPITTAHAAQPLAPIALVPMAANSLGDLESKNSRQQLALKISDAFFSHWAVFADRGFAPYQKAYQAQHVLHNQAIQWRENDQWQFGICNGIAIDGALRVQTENDEMRSLYSSSVSVRLRD
jgi:BirA family transcriptional regulator, biotin operon repressor / biotin---[acetyl-CoA-carboxylase] ligase